MPKKGWKDPPPALRDHLFERLRERKINAQDLCELKLWRESEPEAAHGACYKDFGSFKIPKWPLMDLETNASIHLLSVETQT